MKFSYNWLKELTGLKISATEMAKLLTFQSFEAQVGPKVGADTILEIDVLPNRAHDCLSHVGVAKEILVAKGKGTLKLKKFFIRENTPQSKELLSISIKSPRLCRRYSGRFVSGVKAGPSPQWLKNRLKICGLQSINNIVDATYYVMLETGQPLHAFDAEKLSQDAQGRRQIIVRTAKEDEKIKTIDCQDFKLRKGILLIADAKKPLAIAGIKGGAGSEITRSTKTIVIESANFEPVSTAQIDVVG